MNWRLIIAALLVIGITNAALNCKKEARKLKRCRKKGYAIGDCTVADNGELSKKWIRRCNRLLRYFKKKCGSYQCKKGNKIMVINSISIL